jgi:HAD superfamily hydrolase (TIGR01509 family)
MSDFCPQAVIFDMDGLLVDSEPVWAVAEGAMMAARGKQSDPEIQKSLVGLRMNDFLSSMCRAYGMSDSVETLRGEIVGRMVNLIPVEVKPRPGAPELLEWLYARGIPCAIASSSPMPIIDATVTAQGWDRYFRTHVSGDDVVHGKPAPDIYLEAARRLGADPVVCLTLEDSPTGARAAVAAGMICYAVPDPSHTSAAAFEKVTPHTYVSLHEVRTGLESCG